MKFVHLTTQSNISKIKANGLKLGNGRRGKGLYMMPLLPLKYFNFDNNTIIDRSSQLFWKWLIKERKKFGDGQGKTVAIIFTLQEHHWPLTVFINLSKNQAEKFIPALPEQNNKLFSYNFQLKTCIKNMNYEDYMLDTNYIVYSEKGIGKLFNLYRSTGCVLPINSDRIEVVTQKPVSSDCIEKIISFYKTNEEFKMVKNTKNTINLTGKD